MSITRTDEQWRVIANKALEMLTEKEVKTITKAAQMLGVSDLMLRRKSKVLGINLNIRGQGAKKIPQKSKDAELWASIFSPIKKTG